jgi:hypothetical protein
MCTIAPQGSGFSLDLSASSSAGHVTLTSPSGAPVTASAGGTVALSISGPSGSFASSACTLSFMYLGSPIPVNPPIADGRVWGHVACPSAQPTGGGGACDVQADFLFEECTE